MHVTFLPILENNFTVWSPHLIKDIDNIKNMQRNFIWHLFKRCGLPSMPHNDRFVWLQLPCLELRRIRKDLIMCYKIMHGHVSLELSDFFVLSNNSRTRGHNFNLFKKQFYLDVS